MEKEKPKRNNYNKIESITYNYYEIDDYFHYISNKKNYQKSHRIIIIFR